MHKQKTDQAIVLIKKMAHMAHTIRDLISAALEQYRDSENIQGLYQLYATTPETSSSEFADITAQVLAVSLFAARYYHTASAPFQRRSFDSTLLYKSDFQRQFFEAIRETCPQDEALCSAVDALIDLLAAADMESIRAHLQLICHKDPLTYFYEAFLQHYNPRLRAMRGVYYTPSPVVSYMVHSIDYLLRTRFGCAEGLADTASNISILDPACGTGIFLQAILEHIQASYEKQGAAENWSQHLAQYFLPRMLGIELLRTPYLIAQLTLHLYLADMVLPGRPQGPEEYAPCGRPGLLLQLGNALTDFCRDEELPGRGQARPVPYTNQTSTRIGYEPGLPPPWQRSFLSSKKPVLIILGNPPYAGHSANKDSSITSLLDTYKEGYPELKKPAQAKWLSDDYVKFLRYAQWQIDQAGQGILAFITNHSYLDNPTFRGMRRSLMHSFDELFILDLHGNSKKKERTPTGSNDENVFAIQQGVAISIFVKWGDTNSPPIHHAHLWGSREEKLAWLANHHLENTNWTVMHPQPPSYLFAPQDTQYLAEYEAGWSLPDIFRPNGDPAPGIITCHDDFAIAWSKDEAISKVEWLLVSDTELEARQRFRLCSQDQWHYASAKQALSDPSWHQHLTEILYRPFDTRWTVFNRHVAVHLRERVMRHMLAGKNLGLAIGKAGQVINQHTWDIVFCTRLITEFNLYRRGGNNLFPLYLYTGSSQPERSVNLAPAFIAGVVPRLGMQWISAGHGDLQYTIGPEDIFAYIYAVLYSPTYRARYAPFLKRDFPRLPLTSNHALFRTLCMLGERLVGLHLMEYEVQPVTNYPIPGDNRVEMVLYAPCEQDETTGQVWINASQSFQSVPLTAWTFSIGGYQVCQKWLKDRKGRKLSDAEIEQYQKIVAILAETTRIMREIDRTVEEYGGWPISQVQGDREGRPYNTRLIE